MTWLLIAAVGAYLAVGALFADADRPDKYRTRGDALLRLFAWPVYWLIRGSP